MMIFMPQNFINNLLGIEKLYFVGNTVFPYVFVALFLGHCVHSLISNRYLYLDEKILFTVEEGR